MRPRVGSVCSGFGGLDMAVAEIFDGDVAWFFEYEAAPSKVLAHHWPAIPNYGDLTKADWKGIERVHIMCGGTPCQDLSGAGKRAGMTEGTRSNLWVQMREGIAIQRPAIVIWENVRGAYSACADSEMGRCPRCMGEPGEHRPFLRAIGRVLGDLSALGYDSELVPVRASDAGAAHERYRTFVIATDTRRSGRDEGWLTAAIETARGWASTFGSGPARASAYASRDEGWEWDGDEGALADPRRLSGERRGGQVDLAGTLGAGEVDGSERKRDGNAADDRHTNATNPAGARRSGREDEGAGSSDASARTRGIESERGDRERLAPRLAYLTPAQQILVDETYAFWDRMEDKHPYFISEDGKDFWPAIQSHERMVGRPVPPSSIPDGKGGKFRYSPVFGEWLIDAPEGHLTAPEIGLTANEIKKAVGNGVVRAQARLALTIALSRISHSSEIAP